MTSHFIFRRLSISDKHPIVLSVRIQLQVPADFLPLRSDSRLPDAVNCNLYRLDSLTYHPCWLLHPQLSSPFELYILSSSFSLFSEMHPSQKSKKLQRRASCYEHWQNRLKDTLSFLDNVTEGNLATAEAGNTAVRSGFGHWGNLPLGDNSKVFHAFCSESLRNCKQWNRSSRGYVLTKLQEQAEKALRG